MASTITNKNPPLPPQQQTYSPSPSTTAQTGTTTQPTNHKMNRNPNLPIQNFKSTDQNH